MADDQEDVQAPSQHAQAQAPGGRVSRGPTLDPGGETEPGGLVPPYAGRTGSEEDTTDAAAAAEGRTGKAYDASNAPAPDAPPPVTQEEREGMSATDVEPDAPLGVGESDAKGAEEQAPDRPDVGTKDGRPAGKVADDDSGSIGTTGPIDPKMPDLQAGDQGG